MANILFLCHRIPYPPNKGDKIRSWNFLSRMFEHHNVHLGFFIDNPSDAKYVPFLEESASSVCAVSVRPFFQKLLALRGMLSGQSLTENAYPISRLRTYTQGLISNNEIDLIFLFSAATMRIVPQAYSGPVISDLVDVDSEKWAAYGASASWPMSKVYTREAKKLGAFEAALTHRSDAAIFVSSDEAALFRNLHPEIGLKVHAISNGVDVDVFKPERFQSNTKPNHVIFTGAMDYQPNIEAAEWFIEHVWPRIRQQFPEATFEVAGGPDNNPVNRFSSIAGVKVSGFIEDMAASIAEASVVVAPLRTARGIQNKVLEGLALGKPVVATSLANEGINAHPGEHIQVADDPEGFANCVVALLNNRTEAEMLGSAGREFVVENFSWEQAYNELEALIQVSMEAER